jgi:tripartite-type tricarboxylate transporter receptor subunit TctC
MNADAIAALNDSTIRRRLEQDGYRIVGSTAEELATLLAAETDKWGAVIRASGIRID